MNISPPIQKTLSRSTTSIMIALGLCLVLYWALNMRVISSIPVAAHAAAAQIVEQAASSERHSPQPVPVPSPAQSQAAATPVPGQVKIDAPAPLPLPVATPPAP